MKLASCIICHLSTIGKPVSQCTDISNERFRKLPRVFNDGDRNRRHMNCSSHAKKRGIDNSFENFRKTRRYPPSNDIHDVHDLSGFQSV